jgi:glycosyltransferase involved in cell wall biosynthesis
MRTDGTFAFRRCSYYNEEHTVGDIISRLQMFLQPQVFWYEINVVDDCSTDGSVEVAKTQGVTLYRLRLHMGKGTRLGRFSPEPKAT